MPRVLRLRSMTRLVRTAGIEWRLRIVLDQALSKLCGVGTESSSDQCTRHSDSRGDAGGAEIRGGG